MEKKEIWGFTSVKRNICIIGIVSNLSYACLGGGARDEIRVYYFVRLYPLRCFEIIQVYTAMVAHLSPDLTII